MTPAPLDQIIAVKPLEWGEPLHGTWHAYGGIVRYLVAMSKSDGKYHARRGFPADEFFGPFETLSEAQDAAQADYSARILSAIDPAFLNALSEATSRLDGHINYGIDLQRIIEDLCNSRDIREPVTSARFHYDMAVQYRASAERAEAERDAAVGAKWRDDRDEFVVWMRAWVSDRYGKVITYRTAWAAFEEFSALRRRARSQEDAV